MADSQNKPIFGFCHGAFAINDLTGGINGKVEGHFGDDHEIQMNGTKYTVNSWHSQSIQRLGENMIPIALDKDGNIEAFEHLNKQIVGVLWHPERMETPILPDTIKRRL
jgi:putative glutamine amidotransferase